MQIGSVPKLPGWDSRTYSVLTVHILETITTILLLKIQILLQDVKAMNWLISKGSGIEASAQTLPSLLI